jgi:ABC-type nitrate/sulfonate/bicarbonate transport system permease component
MQMKAIIKERRTPDLEAEQIDALLNDTGSKISQGLAWSAIIIALSIAAVFGVYEFYSDSSISWSEKLLASLLWGGIMGLFLSVVRQQLKARKTDKYKKVKL